MFPISVIKKSCLVYQYEQLRAIQEIIGLSLSCSKDSAVTAAREQANPYIGLNFHFLASGSSRTPPFSLLSAALSLYLS